MSEEIKWASGHAVSAVCVVCGWLFAVSVVQLVEFRLYLCTKDRDLVDALIKGRSDLRTLDEARRCRVLPYQWKALSRQSQANAWAVTIVFEELHEADAGVTA